MRLRTAACHARRWRMNGALASSGALHAVRTQAGPADSGKSV
ncbi:hypothetical protein BSIN_4837 [Burkholderia singularis]|uniref:Uncharacterized protein n=1 Tax=Burkholderia singularis TaxID=1503053 RepID=A0A238HAI4_9BURK|nr:hypothetical protein BSIN_4837 [Burkholderia singularis]